MSTALLSICMPTYNYGRFLSRALESVAAQRDEDVEVVILDGGSTDETERVVAEWQARWPAVRYVRQEARGGIDADLARSVELARGEYCWLLSADDALAEGALQRIRAAFAGGADVVLCNRLWCDARLAPLDRHSWLRLDRDDRFALGTRADLARYLASARSLGALFSFMSCIGFRREAWAAVGPPAAVPCYTHVGRLFALARRGAPLQYLAEAIVLCRGGADSFRASGLAGRLLIDLRGYRALAQVLFGDDAELRRAFLAVVRREHPLRRWVRARGETTGAAQWQEVREELRRYGMSELELALVELGGVAWRGVRSLSAERP